MPSDDASPSGSPRKIQRLSAAPYEEGAFAVAQPACPAQSADGWTVWDAPRATTHGRDGDNELLSSGEFQFAAGDAPSAFSGESDCVLAVPAEHCASQGLERDGAVERRIVNNNALARGVDGRGDFEVCGDGGIGYLCGKGVACGQSGVEEVHRVNISGAREACEAEEARQWQINDTLGFLGSQEYQAVLSSEAGANSLITPGGRSPVGNISRRSGACERAVRGGRDARGVTTAAERNDELASFDAFLSSQEGRDCVSSDSDGVIQNHVNGRPNGSGPAGESGKPKLTREQQAVVDSLPEVLPETGRIIRVTSGAGTGKTTTASALLSRCQSFGFKALYLAFNRATAEEARSSMCSPSTARPAVDCRTIHSCAMRVIGSAGKSFALCPDIKVFVRNVCRKDIRKLTAGISTQSRRSSATRRITKLVIDAYNSYTAGPVGDLPGQAYALRYPNAEKYHNEGDVPGLCMWHSAKPVYESMVISLFNSLTSFPPDDRAANSRSTTYDTCIKDVQLKRTPIERMDVLVVDEAQDCSAAQLLWLSGQARPRKIVFFIGDTAQSIYGFRGAKPDHLAKLETFCSVPILDFALTACFRFGKVIGAVANLVLFAKEHSPQRAAFSPYRLRARATDPGVVTGDSLLATGLRTGTVLTRYNASLVEVGLALFANFGSMGKALKVSILGNQSSGTSGKEGLKRVCLEIGRFLDVYLGNETTISGLGFEGLCDLDWDKVLDMVRHEGLSSYIKHCQLVEKYGESTMEVLEEFSEKILSQNITPDDADFIIGTIHSAKGMEFDNVQLHNDVFNLSRFAVAGTAEIQSPERWANVSVMPTCFDIMEWRWENEEVNLIYVGLTRAKSCLSVPASIVNLIGNLSAIDDHFSNTGAGKMKESLLLSCCRSAFTWEDVSRLQQAIVAPWKAEVEAACGKDGLSSILKVGAPKLLDHGASKVGEECGGDEALIGF